MWTDTFDAFFFITLAGLLLAAFKYGVEYCQKSKCSDFQLCCIKIHRDVRVEADIEQATLQARAAGVVVPEPTVHEANIPNYSPKRRATT
jgi:hypothetical protein